jgi:helix-turn-helix protein
MTGDPTVTLRKSASSDQASRLLGPIQSSGAHLSAYGRDLESITRLRVRLESVPAIPIEKAAELLDLSIRTLYRRRGEFEHRRHNRHLYFTLRSIKEHIEIEQYNPTPSFDITISDVFDISDDQAVDNRTRRT